MQCDNIHLHVRLKAHTHLFCGVCLIQQISSYFNSFQVFMNLNVTTYRKRYDKLNKTNLATFLLNSVHLSILILYLVHPKLKFHILFWTRLWLTQTCKFRWRRGEDVKQQDVLFSGPVPRGVHPRNSKYVLSFIIYLSVKSMVMNFYTLGFFMHGDKSLLFKPWAPLIWFQFYVSSVLILSNCVEIHKITDFGWQNVST